MQHDEDQFATGAPLTILTDALIQPISVIEEHQNLQTTYRWWIAAPGQDETIRSLVERADRLNGAQPLDIAYVWQDVSKPRSYDAPSSREILRMARMLDVSPETLFRLRLEDGPHLLQPIERRAYCPQCIYEDNAAGRPRAFRRAWARFFVVSCPIHGVPLHWAEPRLSALNEVDMKVPWLPDDPWQRKLLKHVDQFALILEMSLTGKMAWPTSWHGTPSSARAYLARHLCNLIGTPTTLPIVHLWTDDLPFPFVAVPKRPTPPLHGSAWETVRGIGRPAWRRAALWLTAWKVIPDLPARWRPVTLPDNYLDAIDEWWDGVPATKLLKQRRTYTRLRRACIPIVADPARGRDSGNSMD